ncbi:MAG: hypothetical protein A2156_15010 [Deltaproteobacteria bacterium RBG_16_48_10]|nr:MAG: hypothetical protein A2156_15010 [Deltaproteobacteria bacterium RBG_16_48_10]
MKTKIGQMAGRAWKTLGEKEEVVVSRLPQILREKGGINYQPLDWLAREGKINYHEKRGKIFWPSLIMNARYLESLSSVKTFKT